MGGGGNPIQDVINVVRDATEISLTGGTLITNEGKKVKKGVEGMVSSITGEAAREAAAKGEAAALAQETKQNAKLAAQDEKFKLQQEFSRKRSRQKSLMGGNSGRSSTILTSPLGTPSTGAGAGGKTALGQ